MKPSKCILIIFLTSFTYLFLASSGLFSQSKLLGEVHFPNSGADEAQDSFMEGLLFLHNFEYRDAAISFRRAQEIDPGFVMAYWGEAMTKNQPIWFRQQREEAIEVLNKLAPDPEARQQVSATQREKDYLYTIEVLFGTTPETKNLSKEERDFAYRDEMRQLHQLYPEDHEARSFYGLSMLGTAHDGRDFRLYMQAAAVLMPVWDDNRKHPGAAHYLIHSFDDPIHAPLGLPMAKAYSEIAPAAAHAQHMTSHIFVAMGMWDDVVHANEVASEVEITREKELGEPTTVCGHNLYWLVYGYLQQGRYNNAGSIIDTCYERVIVDQTNSNLWHFAMMKARYLIDTERWGESKRWVLDYSPETAGSTGYLFADAYAAIQEDGLRKAEENIELLSQAESVYSSDHLLVMITQLNGLMELAKEDTAAGLSQLKQATKMEFELPLDYGPPAVLKPSFELLGETLFQLERYDEAAEAFQTQLDLSPKRTNTMHGLARTYEKTGDLKAASQLYSELRDIWHSADTGLSSFH
ncbi:MAG: tetratricopeptide repeat protein [Balneolaceae bacterium]